MKFLLILVILFNSSCIHVASTEYASIDLENTKTRYEESLVVGSTKIDHLIYTESVYPLEKFLDRLIAGDFKEILKKIDLEYKPSNTDNKIILELIKEGLIPVYVSIQNNGVEPITISEKDFFLDDNNQTIQALSFRKIPHYYQRFSSDAIFANTINIGVVVVSTIVGLAALGIVFKDVPIANVSSGQKWNSRYDKSGARIREENSEILNEVRKTTQINYKKYLLSERVIEPNQSVQGLIFFKKEPTNQKIFLKYYPRN